MIYKCLFLLLIRLATIEAGSTSLKHNQLEFSNGAGFSDSISEDLPIDIIDASVSYEDYLSYVYGFSVYELGTVNVLGGASKNVLFGQWIGDIITTTENVFSGTEGFSPLGRMGTAGGDQNAYSDLQIAKSENGNAVWFRSDTNDKNQLDSYKTVDASFTPINPLSLAFQAEAGDLYIKSMMRVQVGTSSGNVGIGTTFPESHLHINGNVKATGLFGEIGKIISLPYVSDAQINLNSSTFVNLYSATFSPTEWPSQMDGMVFVSFFTQTSTQTNVMKFILVVYEGTPTSEGQINSKSGTAVFDTKTGVDYRNFSLFTSLTIDPSKTYTVRVIGISDGTLSINIFNASAFVYALPSE